MRSVVFVPDPLHPLGPRLLGLLKGRLGEREEHALVPFDQADHLLVKGSVGMLVVVLSHAPDDALALIRKAHACVQGPVLAVGQASDSKLILRALHEGADHYLDETDLEAQLEAVLHRLHGRDQSSASARKGRLVALLGASGGCGTSTLAVNLATILARDHARCGLIDLKPGAGDLAALLDLRPEHNLADLCLNAARMDRAMFEAALVTHPSGVSLLAPPQLYDEIRLVTPRGVQKSLNLSRESFPWTVADLEDCFHEEQVIALRQADFILLVFRLDFTALRNARRALEHFERLAIPMGQIRLVINRYGQARELPVVEAEEALGQKIAFFVPEDAKTINTANNAGVPVVLKSPSSRVAQSFVQLAQFLGTGNGARAAGPSGRSGSWLASLY